MTRWPDAVWRSPWLRGLDGVAREAVQAAGLVHSLGKGARVFAPGDPADAIFVVGEGLVDVRAVRRGEAERARRAGPSRATSSARRRSSGRARRASRRRRAPRGRRRGGAGRGVPPGAARAGEGHAGPLEEALRRAAARDVLRSSALAPDLSDADVEVLLGSTEARVLARGERLFVAGDPATHAYLVADGLVQLRAEAGGKLRVRAYLSRGDLVADERARACGRPRR